MERILIVEDSKFFGSMLMKRIEVESDFEVRWAQSYAEAEAFLNEQSAGFFLGLLDLNLPDAPMGEIVDLVLGRGIPAVVFTGDLTDEARDNIWSKNVVDYVLKEDAQSIDYILALIARIRRNKSVKVMVVDDSRLSRKIICDLLREHQYRILEAEDGVQAVKILEQHPDISLVLTDYNMPNMDGFELTRTIRAKFRQDELPIIGLSGQGSNFLSAQFIKNGANDFINKPFLNEEFYCRVNQSIEMVENINKIKDMSNKDYLTGLYNRRFFFEVGYKMFARSKRSSGSTTVALIDIDFFKKVNDTYGHDVGDKVLVALAGFLKDRFRETDVVSRFGGEEFCLLLADMGEEYVPDIFEDLLAKIAALETKAGDRIIRFTVSIGVCTRLGVTLEAMIKEADLLLYKAKSGGRNRVELDI
ncbi:MAG: diguanylate cyclase response regulator [Deltaproteobacteria bacterium RIFOXYD12_FULL_57_12]|nr:MAG: diguanylate cyclase response regulator [Deltaproteobacteria bacterium RIFOXYD12_FULL_57_12]